MTIPLSPSISLSPSSFSGSGQTIVASVSLPNRPSYAGHPKITGLTTITPKIICSRSPTGVMPFHIQVSACETSCDAGNAYRDLHYHWDFGDPDGTETAVDQWNGKTVNLNDSQIGPEAAYIYRTPGTYTITLTVTGKDENGDLITASTTTLMTNGQYYVARGARFNPSYGGTKLGGTFTLTVNGETTANISATGTNDDVYNELLSLSGLDDTNMRITYLGNIELFGNRSGISNTVTIDGTNLTNVVSGTSPTVLTDITPVTASVVTVNDFTGLTVEYYDSTAGGGGDGSIGSPKNSSSALKSFVFGGSNRVAYIKRGSTFTFGQFGSYGDIAGGQQTVRILPYGSGADPILADSEILCELNASRSGAARKVSSDLVISSINVQQTSLGNFVWWSVGPNGTAGYPFGSMQDLVLDNITYEQMTATESGSAAFCSVQKANNPSGDNGRLYNADGINYKGIHWWKCEVDMRGRPGILSLMSISSWYSVVGCYLTGGQGNLSTEHHLYPNVLTNSLYRYIEFGPGFDNANLKGRNFCINGNVHGNSKYSSYHLIDGCYITGTQNGIDLSNEANLDYRPYGQFSDVIVQFTKITSGWIGTQNNGLYGANNNSLVVRYNDFFHSLTGMGVSSTNYWIYKNRFWDCEVEFRGAIDYCYFHDNIIHFDASGGSVNCCMVFWDSAAITSAQSEDWDSDGNVYYAPNQSGIIHNATTRISLATWQAAPYNQDPNGQNVNPGWYDGEEGQFVEGPVARVNWPDGFTSLESSVDDGGSWQSYTDNSDLSIGAYLSTHDTILFRAVTDTSTSNQTISGASDADSLDTSSESYSVILTYDGEGGGGGEYYVMQVGQLVYIINTGA